MVKKNTMRLTSDERRQAIIDAVKKVFARNGFDGTTTRELATAAGVSEALLFKHFPNKEALYDAVIESCADEPGFADIVTNRFIDLKPSTATLITMVHSMISHFVNCCDLNHSIMDRLAVQSILADGEFLRRTIKKVAETWIRKFEECLNAAQEDGNIRETPVRTDLRFWFTHHIAFSLLLHLDMPKDPALNYKASTGKLIEQAVWYALMGIGVKEEAIKRLYNPKALALQEKD
jgi:AcrR family transcriptional regulator